jgi:hypothetical protein
MRSHAYNLFFGWQANGSLYILYSHKFCQFLCRPKTGYKTMWLRPEKRATGAVSSQTGRLNRSRSQSLMAREGQKMFMNMQRHGESERLTGQTKGSHTLKALHSGLHLEVRYHPFSFLFLSFLVVVRCCWCRFTMEQASEMRWHGTEHI